MSKQELRKQLLASYVRCTVDDIKESNSGIKNSFHFDGSDYLVLAAGEVEGEIQEQVIEYFDQFDIPFLQKHLKVNIDSETMEIILDNCCSVCKLLFFELFANTTWFFHDAIETYGRAHFLAWYDGKEHAVCTLFDGCFYIYRMTGPK